MRAGINIIVIFSVFALGCSSSEDPEVVINIEQKYVISPIEALNPGQNHLTFNVKSYDISYCKNQSITSKVLFRGDFIDIGLAPDDLMSNCDPGQHYPAVDLIFGALPQEEYHLNITLDGLILNQGILMQDDEKYTLEMGQLNGLTFHQLELYKIPQKTIWGYIFTADSDTRDNANEFLTDLKNNNPDSNFNAGYYGHFSVNDQSQLEMDVSSYHPHKTLFILKYEGDLTALKQSIDHLRSEHSGNIDIKVFSEDGQEM